MSASVVFLPFHQAKQLIAAGFRVLPLQPDAAGWVPAVDGFGIEYPDATFGLDWFGEPDGAVAILCGPCPALPADTWLVVLDVDGDPATHPELAAFLASLPPTLTGHAGAHRYYRVPAGTPCGPAFKRGAGYTHDGLDVKGPGGYVRARWTWSAPPALDLVAALPAGALAALAGARAARVVPPVAAPAACGDPAGELVSLGFDPAEVLTDAELWLRTQAPRDVADGAGGAACLVVAGALLVGFGLDDAKALELMVDVWAPLAWPGEDPEENELERKLDEIERLGSERFAPLQLALVARDVRRGATLTRSDEVAAGLALAPLGTPPATMRSLEEGLLTWQANLQRTAKGDIKIGAHNIAITLAQNPWWAGLFGYDDFAKEVTYLRDPEPGLGIIGARAGGAFDEDNHVFAIQAWLSFNAAEANASAVIAAVHAEARKRTFHPVRDWLGALPPWDGVDRNLAAYLGAELTDYHRAVCAKWLRSAVARAMVPGAKADTMLILEGEQGWRKSTAIRCLCPDTRWFYEAASRDVGSKDFMQDMRGKWLCEIPEVDQLIRSRDESELKALLSRTGDNYRPSYARKAHDFPRQLVFAGTTNHEGYLRDETGNRRYWAIKCGAVGPILDGAICDDRDQLWAQALAEYASGQKWWLTPEEDSLARTEQTDRIEEDPWATFVWRWRDEHGDEPFTIHEAMGNLPGAKPAAELTAGDLNRMTKVLRTMGFRRGPQETVGGHRVRRWRLA